MSNFRFEYNEDTLVKILKTSQKRPFLTYQISNNPTVGESIDPEEQKILDQGRRTANDLLHLDIAEGMGLMKLVAHSTERTPLAHDINGRPIRVSTYRITFRGLRYLKYPKLYRGLLRNFHEIKPLIAIFGILIAWLSLLISIWIQ
ncbi:MAG: hypothetical protein F4X40_07040 [Chloroflexi bacterium]|nr:hypothetical protein [Chloroflexota bacterium]